ncbi:23S rRNA pseudouridine(2605) synthase RluB [Gallaecimonas xiamenensis]|uniref:Pseudouridine synthase n=1 Tax=Gallaecimonas xiamenensis 3-C-1 TaxID=745411 RepID=K2J772_9GAMM|nr:23S rRNA pseudouridine(2605) synthase RluB [Gallaecimonas xiamenensis]EKE70938.1 ribosomal large subunit pseudouridine synthase B [Gallaecimonas xiamenensis 3-C-1]
MTEKLQKVLARAGHGSRRQLEALISAGRISVNGKVATLGDRIDSHAEVRIDGHIVAIASQEEVVCRVLMYNKPEGELCSRKDPEGRPTVFDRLPRLKQGRWVAVGRLDINTSGLLLFTTDGELANRLMHPSHQVEREYQVRVFGEVNESMLHKLRKGVQLEDGPASFNSIKRSGGEGMNQWFAVTLSEGRNREVRRLWESQEVKVSRLIRTQYGKMELDRKLPQGGWKELGKEEVNYLRNLVGLAPETRTMLDERAVAQENPYVKAARIRRAVKRDRARENSGTQARRARKPT